MQGGAELEKLAGLEQSVQTRSSLVCLGPLSVTHSHPVPLRGRDRNLGLRAGDQRGRGECLGFKLGLEGKETGRDREGEGGEQERHWGSRAGVGAARSLGLPEVERAWGREGMSRGRSLLQASPAGLFPHLGVAVAVLCVPRNRLWGPPSLAPPAFTWDLVPGGCLSTGPSRSRAGEA